MNDRIGFRAERAVPLKILDWLVGKRSGKTVEAKSSSSIRGGHSSEVAFLPSWVIPSENQDISIVEGLIQAYARNQGVNPSLEIAKSDAGYAIVSTLFPSESFRFTWHPYPRPNYPGAARQSDGQEAERDRAEQSLGLFGPDVIAPLLALINDVARDERSYNDRNKQLRARAVWVLSKFPTPEVLSALVDLLTAAEYEVASQASHTLEHFGDLAIDPLASHLDASDAKMRTEILSILGTLAHRGHKAVVPALLKAYESSVKGGGKVSRRGGGKGTHLRLLGGVSPWFGGGWSGALRRP